MVLSLKFTATPDGEDAVYFYKPGRGEVFVFRPDWMDKNALVAAAITYLGKRGHERKHTTGGQEEIYLSCTVFDFINEPAPAFTVVDMEQLPKDEKIIPITRKIRKA